MDVPSLELFYRFGVALVIGLLIGLQREYAFREEKERTGELLAGARTFPLISLLGAATALIAETAGSPAVLAAVAAGVALLLAAAHYQRARERETGLTTEIAALLSLAVGMLCAWDDIEVAAALGVGTAVLLALKVETHSLAASVTREDVFATLKFAVITVIVLPILPQTGYGPPPWDVLVPYNIWLMVVLISGISFLGYVLIKTIGARRGVGLTGLLGGLASSTAVTLSLAQRSRTAERLSRSFAMAVVLAWTLMFVRVLVEVAVVNRALLPVVAGPVVGIMGVGVIYAAYLYVAEGDSAGEDVDLPQNPFHLLPAITFGVLYAAILVATSVAQTRFGDAGLYVSSFVSGLADVDAVTLSMARLSGPAEPVSPETAARAILLAAAANTLLKGAIVVATGSTAIRRPILVGMLLLVATAAGMLLVV
jgi:uncharacterized membrane protein (DUF4010 family)